MSNSDILTQTEAARRIGVSSTAIMFWIRSGRLPARKAGGIVLIDAGELEKVNAWSLNNKKRQQQKSFNPHTQNHI